MPRRVARRWPYEPAGGFAVAFLEEALALRASGILAFERVFAMPELEAEHEHVLWTVGRVSMEMMTVDLSEAPGEGMGGPVELWGTRVPVNTVAAQAGTIPCELSCHAKRVPRVCRQGLTTTLLLAPGAAPSIPVASPVARLRSATGRRYSGPDRWSWH